MSLDGTGRRGSMAGVRGTGSPSLGGVGLFTAALPWTPDVVIPQQWFRARRSELCAEKRLMLAVLEDAVKVWNDTRGCGPGEVGDRMSQERAKLRAAVQAWFVADDPMWVFSFVNICDALDLNAEWLRRGLGLSGAGAVGVTGGTGADGSSPGGQRAHRVVGRATLRIGARHA